MKWSFWALSCVLICGCHAAEIAPEASNNETVASVYGSTRLALDVCIASKGSRISMIYHTMSEDDVQAFLREPFGPQFADGVEPCFALGRAFFIRQSAKAGETLTERIGQGLIRIFGGVGCRDQRADGLADDMGLERTDRVEHGGQFAATDIAIEAFGKRLQIYVGGIHVGKKIRPRFRLNISRCHRD